MIATFGATCEDRGAVFVFVNKHCCQQVLLSFLGSERDSFGDRQSACHNNCGPTARHCRGGGGGDDGETERPRFLLPLD